MSVNDEIYKAAREQLDISLAVQDAREAIGIAMGETIRPSVLFKPKLFLDGNQWCALYGESLAVGLAGFGDSPDAAMRAFDAAWVKKGGA